MPIFHDPSDGALQRQVPRQSPSPDSEHAWRAGSDYEGTLLDTVNYEHGAGSHFDSNREATNQERKSSMLGRVYLMERLKRGNSPSWDHYRNASPEPRPTSKELSKTPICSPIQIRTSRPSTPDLHKDDAAAGLEIERPRSALHSGDFREKRQRTQFGEDPSSQVSLATSPVVPWNQSFPAAARPSGRTESPYSFHHVGSYDPRPTTRARAISQSSFPSFAFMPPTSPLVQQSNNTDLDFSSRPSSRQTSKSPERNNRRHTFSPQSLQAFKSNSMARTSSGTPAARHFRKVAVPYQAHQPRRSVTSLNTNQPHPSPQNPFLGPRRPSFSSEASPLHHAPMVGSYEESILRGRMSTTPSRPLNFIAKIGVLGRGKCKPNLKCPPHVAVPFPAVFYSYSSGNGRISDDSPSPYVGLIDLENSLQPVEENNDETSKRKRLQQAANAGQDDFDFQSEHAEFRSPCEPYHDVRREEKRKRRSTSPKAPPGGSYRIPQLGQLQLVIKNPNKTAVKLFLVPYDLSDMEPGRKTFVRQRSYSAGPVIDMPMSSRRNLGTDRPEAALSNSDDPNDRPMLRYLIHLHICCPSKGRYYLYKSIRVVFANRVPDGKEKLRNEIQLPEPRYSSYKASRESLASQVPPSATAQRASEKVLRRRSAGISLSQQAYDQLDGISPTRHIRPPLPPPAVELTGGHRPSYHSSGLSPPRNALGPVPFSLTHIPSLPCRPLSREMDVNDDSPFRSRVASESSGAGDVGSPTGSLEDSAAATAFEKLGRNAFCGVTASGAGLLAKRLRGLDVQRGSEDGNI